MSADPSTPGALWRGVAWGLVAVLIWAGWLVTTTMGARGALTTADLALFRSLIPALLLTPLLWRARSAVRAVGLRRAAQLALYGAPFVLLVGGGLQTAPVAHAGVIVPGLMPVFAAAIGAALLGERFPKARLVGFALILLAIGFVATDAGVFDGGDLRAHALFVAGALGWAIFTVTARPLGLSPYLTTAIVGLVSAAPLALAMLIFDLSRMTDAPLIETALHAGWQGLLSGFASIYAYGKAIQSLGASQAAALAALVPFAATAMAAPILGQAPGAFALVGMLVVGAGVYLAVGAPPPWLRRS